MTFTCNQFPPPKASFGSSTLRTLHTIAPTCSYVTAFKRQTSKLWIYSHIGVSVNCREVIGVSPSNFSRITRYLSYIHGPLAKTRLRSMLSWKVNTALFLPTSWISNPLFALHNGLNLRATYSIFRTLFVKKRPTRIGGWALLHLVERSYISSGLLFLIGRNVPRGLLGCPWDERSWWRNPKLA